MASSSFSPKRRRLSSLFWKFLPKAFLSPVRRPWPQDYPNAHIFFTNVPTGEKFIIMYYDPIFHSNNPATSYIHYKWSSGSDHSILVNSGEVFEVVCIGQDANGPLLIINKISGYHPFPRA